MSGVRPLYETEHHSLAFLKSSRPMRSIQVNYVVLVPDDELCRPDGRKPSRQQHHG